MVILFGVDIDRQIAEICNKMALRAF